MSALGDYVHFHKENYSTWGTNKVGRTGDSNWDIIPLTSYFNNSEKESLLMEAKYLEEEYNKLFYPKEGEISSINNQFKKDLEEAVQKKLDKEFGSVAGSSNINTLSVDPNSLYTQLNNAIQETKNRIGRIQVDKNNTATTLLKQVESMYNILNQQEFKNIVEIQSKISEAKNKLNNIKNNLLVEITTIIIFAMQPTCPLCP